MDTGGKGLEGQTHEAEAPPVETTAEAPASFWQALGDGSYKEAIARWRAADLEALGGKGASQAW